MKTEFLDIPAISESDIEALREARSRWVLRAPTPSEEWGIANNGRMGFSAKLKIDDKKPIIKLVLPFDAHHDNRAPLVSELITLLEVSTSAWRAEYVVVPFMSLEREPKYEPYHESERELRRLYPSVVGVDGTSISGGYQNHCLSPVSRLGFLRKSGPQLRRCAEQLYDHEWIEIANSRMLHKSGFELRIGKHVQAGNKFVLDRCDCYLDPLPKRLRIARIKQVPASSGWLDMDQPPCPTIWLFDDSYCRLCFNRSSDWQHLPAWAAEWLSLRS